MTRSYVRNLLASVVAVASGLVALSALLSLPDLVRAGAVASHFGPLTVEEAHALIVLYNQKLNQLLGSYFTTVAIAVPLTANMYSIKFLDFFIKDRVNIGVLGLVVFAAFDNGWLAYLTRDHFVPVVALHVSFLLLVVSYAAFIPYVFYVFRFLHPNTLLHRLEHQYEEALAAVLAGREPIAAERERASEAFEHIASIAIRSLERNDRATAIESATALERMIRHYWLYKNRLPPDWFRVEPRLFLGYSSAAVDEISLTRTWVETKFLSKLRSIMSVAIPRTHDLASNLAKALRRFGLEPPATSDQALREATMEFFNTFMRMALVARDPRTVFIVYDQYRLFAVAMNPHYPALVNEIAYYFTYYGKLARTTGLDFVAEVAAHDLAKLVRQAWEAEAPNRQKLLDRLLQFDADAAKPLPGVKKAHAILASYFALVGLPEPAKQVRASLDGMAPELAERVRDDLLHVHREKYWEVNERRMNLDFVPDEQRETLRRILDALVVGPRKTGGGPATA
jgi:Ca2+/Na+ antiporter